MSKISFLRSKENKFSINLLQRFLLNLPTIKSCFLFDKLCTMKMFLFLLLIYCDFEPFITVKSRWFSISQVHYIIAPCSSALRSKINEIYLLSSNSQLSFHRILLLNLFILLFIFTPRFVLTSRWVSTIGNVQRNEREMRNTEGSDPRKWIFPWLGCLLPLLCIRRILADLFIFNFHFPSIFQSTSLRCALNGSSKKMIKFIFH